MDIGETLYVTSRREWRRWLAHHHRHKNEIWLIFYKKATGTPSISYDASVEEAICYGWIDGQLKSIDQGKFARRFTPRERRSTWSNSNLARALRMLRAGKMTKAGKVLLPDKVLGLHKPPEPPHE
jgi:uncharacterized protein YdeI (YjbR/CyaY-like superfamily)